MSIELLHQALRLVARKSSDDDDDDRCSGSAKNSASCAKPQSEDSLTIGLAVGLPVLAVIIMLGVLLLRNYRKNKKEDMEHDPDFDENGEATALPDFPHAAKRYEMEDPFDNRNSVRFPPYSNPGYHNSSASIAPSKGGDGYVESFVLPYQHQTGLKVSLDEYARQLGEYGLAYGQTPRASYMMGHNRTRNSSLSNFQYLNPAQSKSAAVSPQKSNLKNETANKLYENLPNHTLDDTADTHDDSNDGIEEVSDSDSDESVAPKNQFGISYENESDPNLNGAPAPRNEEIDTSNDTFDTTTDHNATSHYNSEFNTTTDRFLPQEHPSIKVDSQRDVHNESPFADPHQQKSTDVSNSASGIPEISPLPEEQVDGDFDFSNDSYDGSAANTVGNSNTEQLTANTSATNLEQDEGLNPREENRKSVRISAFNLLKNVSDDENEPEDYDEDKPLDNGLTTDQEEELRRMKSVYKLYFERENSIKKRDSIKSEKEMENAYEFKADPEQPLPEVDMDQYKINNNLRVDTSYNKRLTTTSSIYTDNGVDFAPHVPPQEQYYHYLQDQNFQQFYQQHVQNLPPLQPLPNPSEIRKSTIQTYTDYHPRSKNGQATSPTTKQPFNPIESDNVWTSPVSSPTNPQPTAFGMEAPGTTKMKSLPSATQLSRSSVVMLNPVTEITKQRKFKPAGSLSNVHKNNHAYANMYPQQFYQQPQHLQGSMSQFTSSDDLMNGGSMDDVRKMMNTTH